MASTRRKILYTVGGIIGLGACAAANPEEESDDQPVEDTDATAEADDGNGDESASGGNGDESTSDESEPDTDDSSSTDSSESLGPDAFEMVLDDQLEPPVLDYEQAEGIGWLEVVSYAFGDQQVLAGEMGTVVGVYSSYVEESPEQAPDVMEVDVYAMDEETLAGWYTIEREWVEAYNRGEMTSDEVALRVMQTVQAA